MPTEMDSFLDGEGGDDPSPLPAADAGGAGDGGTPPPVVVEGADPKPPVPPVDPPAEEPPEEVPEDQRGLRQALQAERAKRNDWKGQAERTAGELIATKAALEAAQKAPPAPVVTAPVADPPPTPAPRVMPSPVEDPQGFANFLAEQRFNDTLNISESSLRREVKDNAAVDASVAAFKDAMKANPSLYRQMRQHPDPYQFVYEHGKSILAMAEIGSDPAAYRARVRAEIEAEMAAADGADPPAAADPPAIRLPRSLGTATSAAPRMAAALVVPEFEEIFDRRKRG